jgi:hypothetical protein
MNPKRLLIAVAAMAASLPAWGALARAQAVKTSGIYRTADDYAAGRLAFEGACGSKAHKLAIHDVSNKPYIDVTHDAEKHRYAKSELYGFRACDGRDYRFASKLEYRILEARELYIYSRDITVNEGRSNRTVLEFYFSVGANGQIKALTLENLKQAFPENHRFHDWLDATFSAGQNLGEYDEFHKMFKVNRLLIASRG